MSDYQLHQKQNGTRVMPIPKPKRRKAVRLMTAVLEVKFNPDTMWDEDDLNRQFGGSWLKGMQWLYTDEGLGIFNERIRLVGIKPA